MSEQSWEQNHRRNAVLRDLIAREGALGEVALVIEGVEELFPESDDLLRALHQRWLAILSTCLDKAFEVTESSPRDDIRRAYADARASAPALHRLLERNADHPVLARLIESEYVRIAHTAGLTGAGQAPQAAAAAVAALASPHAQQDGRTRWWQRLFA